MKKNYIDNTTKKELNEMISLIERMDKNSNSKLEKLINEGKSQRIQVTRDEILDVLDKQDENNAGQFASFTYVTPIDLYTTKKKWRHDDVLSALEKHNNLSDKEWYKSLSDYNQETIKGNTPNPIKFAVAVHKYTVHWTSPKNYANKYSDYKEKLSNLRMRYGAGLDSDGMLGDNPNQRTNLGYGNATMSQAGNLQRDFNMIGSKCTTTWYMLDDNGNIVDVLPEEIVKSMMAQTTQKPFANVEAEVRKVLQDNEVALEQYAKEKAEIDKIFKGRTFLMDKILTIVATSDGVQYFYINDTIASKIKKKSEVNVNQQDFIKIAENELNQQFNDISIEKFNK